MSFPSLLFLPSIDIICGVPTNIAPAAHWWAAGGQPPQGSQPTLIHWVAPRWAARWTSEPTLLYSCPPLSTDFLLHWFCPPTADLKPPLCQSQWHRVGFQSGTTGWIVAAGPQCVNPHHDYQQPASGLLNVVLGGHPCHHYTATRRWEANSKLFVRIRPYKSLAQLAISRSVGLLFHFTRT